MAKDSWLDYLVYDVGDFRLKEEIENLRRSAKSNIGLAEFVSEKLSERHDSLLLATVAMWELMSEKLGLTDQMLLQKMEEIDLRDGTKDGRISAIEEQRWECPKCQRVNHPRFARCIGCKNPGPSRVLPGPFEKA